jgi:hypothetical protein
LSKLEPSVCTQVVYVIGAKENNRST